MNQLPLFIHANTPHCDIIRKTAKSNVECLNIEQIFTHKSIPSRVGIMWNNTFSFIHSDRKTTSYYQWL